MRAETWESAKRLGAARCVEVYGSTETGGIGWRSDPAQPLKLLPHLERMGDGVKARAKDTPLPLQDVIAWENDTSFCVIGRGDRVVQVGGTNVDLGLVERTLQQSGHVREAVVRLDGLRLKAFVVPEGEEDAALDGAVRQALAVLPAIARPQELSFGPEIPRTSTGKPSDW
ncbi:MAG: 4-coumarate--CoA ligase, partial [Pseudomonadota bacterium]